MHFYILALLTILPSLAFDTLASPTKTDQSPAEYRARALDSSTTSHAVGPIPDFSKYTNAQRLSRGLPIKPPHRRTPGGSRSIIPRASAIPRAPAVLSVSYHGIIAVTNSANGQTLGYISKNTFDYAQYRYQPSPDDALVVDFSTDSDEATIDGILMNSQNSDIPDFPLMALVQGREDNSTDFSSGSFYYAYVAGMANPGTGPDSVPLTSPANSYTDASGTSRAGVSNVWSFNTMSRALEPRWENSDRSKPNTVSFAQGAALYVGGDQAAFYQRFPTEVIPIAFTFVPQ